MPRRMLTRSGEVLRQGCVLETSCLACGAEIWSRLFALA
jgi:hypothetical protein